MVRGERGEVERKLQVTSCKAQGQDGRPEKPATCNLLYPYTPYNPIPCPLIPDTSNLIPSFSNYFGNFNLFIRLTFFYAD